MAQIALAAPLPAPDSHGITDYLRRTNPQKTLDEASASTMDIPRLMSRSNSI
jgi:hypothetical protein